MNKSVKIILFLLMAFLITSCSSDNRMELGNTSFEVPQNVQTKINDNTTYIYYPPNGDFMYADIYNVDTNKYTLKSAVDIYIKHNADSKIKLTKRNTKSFNGTSVEELIFKYNNKEYKSYAFIHGNAFTIFNFVPVGSKITSEFQSYIDMCMNSIKDISK